MNIQLSDNSTLIEVKTNKDYIRGCETCDFGSQYITYVDFIFEDKLNLKFEVEDKYEHCIHLDDILQFTCNYNFKENTRDDLKRSFAKILIDLAKKSGHSASIYLNHNLIFRKN